MPKWLLLIAVPILLNAQLLLGEQPASRPRPWWDSQVVRDLNLTDAQNKQIQTTVKEYRPRLFDLRTVVNKAETDLEAAFNDDPVDQRKANEAIERLAAARSELTKALSQMDLKLRTILTAQQWQELQKRQPTWPDRPGGRRHAPGTRGVPTGANPQK